jgi:hypothetical protein
MFSQWWLSISQQDADEFVHIHAGTIDGARMVCALDYMLRIERRSHTYDLITRAYQIAHGLDESQCRDAAVRMNAQALYTSDAVVFLRERLDRRRRDEVDEEIHRLTAERLRKLYSATQDDEGNLDLDSKLHSVVLEASNKLLGLGVRERQHEADRRDRRALARAAESNRSAMKTVTAAPTMDEAKAFVQMLRQALPPAEFQEILADIEPHGTTD